MTDNFERWSNIGHAPLGQGGFGQVWKVRTENGSELAAKYINLNEINDVDQRKLHREVNLLKQLNHPNVVRFVTAKKQNGQLIVFTELINGKDLSQLGQLSESTAVGILRQICAGLHYLHSRNPPVLHCDLKGQNIMLTNEGTVKIIDFGLSINLMVAAGDSASDAVMSRYYLCGTPQFIAPELYTSKHFSVKSDVWALGITVYEMLVGRPPFTGLGKNAIVEKIKSQGAPPLPVACSQKMANFYARCTAFKPEDRPSVRVLLQDPLLF